MKQHTTMVTSSVHTVCRDPHHPEIEWKYDGYYFYHRVAGHKKWQLMHKSHITAARIKAFHWLVAQQELVAAK